MKNNKARKTGRPEVIYSITTKLSQLHFGKGTAVKALHKQLKVTDEHGNLVGYTPDQAGVPIASRMVKILPAKCMKKTMLECINENRRNNKTDQLDSLKALFKVKHKLPKRHSKKRIQAVLAGSM